VAAKNRFVTIMVIVFLILMAPSFLPSSRAYEYSIRLIGFRWTTPSISVTICPTGCGDYYNLTLEAVQTWNEALKWYHDNYASKGLLYQFVATNSGSSQVRIDFGTIPNCPDCIGVADQELDFSDGISYFGYVTASVAITVSTGAYSRMVILGTIAHELGHALGLGHTSYSDDLMYEYVDTPYAPISAVYPSTLDLYGVQVVADSPFGKNLDSHFVIPIPVTLPSNVPYQLFLAKRQLQVSVPSQVPVTIDGTANPPGKVQLTLVIGTHELSVPSIVQIDSGARLVFWVWRLPESTYQAQIS
jgi:hypothetical protein